MYYSELLSTLLKQEKSPVNKMYIGELSLRWRAFQELMEESDSTNAAYAEALSQFLLTLHSKKFVFNKLRNTGFHHTSPLFSSYYLHDLIGALMLRQEITKEPGMSWGFNSFHYDFSLTGVIPKESAATPQFTVLQTPPVLSLTQEIELQYRIAGKRNYSRNQLVLPYLLFFAYKSPKQEHLFMIEHYASLARKMSRLVQVFLVCESLAECQCSFSADLPIKVYALQDAMNSGKNEVSVEILDKLEAGINAALNPEKEETIFKLKQQLPEKPVREAPQPLKQIKRIPRSMRNEVYEDKD